MKRLNVFVLLLFSLLGVYAQQIKSYKDECGFEIIIKDSLFYYIEPAAIVIEALPLVNVAFALYVKMPPA